MNFFHRIKLAVILITAHLTHSFLFMAVNCISFIMIIMASAILYMQNLNENICEPVLNENIENLGIVRVENCSDDTGSKIYKEILKKKSICGFGELDSGGAPVFSKEILSLQKENMSEDEKLTWGSNIKVLFVSYDALPIFKYKLYKSAELNKKQLSDENHWCLYLGYNFRDIELGTKYETGNIIYEVAGILQEGQEWFDSQILFGVGEGDMIQNINMNNEIVAISGEDYLADNLIFSSKDNMFDEASDDIYKIADKYDCDLTVGNIKEQMDNAGDRTRVMWGYILKLFVVFYIASFLIGMCLQFIEIRKDLYEYTCLRLTGVLQKDMVWIFAIENGLKLVITYIASAALSRYLLKLMWGNKERVDIIIMVIAKSVYGFGLISLLIAFAISMILPMHFVRKYSIKELMTEVL
ncbi:MAG: hypothetical protein K6G26_11325 [Lachnospiraceae bacterium]|nr:hypothetical protein [Lachnospiraceae bacterium]